MSTNPTSHNSIALETLTKQCDIDEAHIGLPRKLSLLDTHLFKPPPHIIKRKYYPLAVESPAGLFQIFVTHPPYKINDYIDIFDPMFHSPFVVLGFDADYTPSNGWHHVKLRTFWDVKEHGTEGETEICYGYVPKDFIKSKQSSKHWKRFTSWVHGWFGCP
ncbi:hypothetical protein K439DRAFT_1619167 [Ramaria rubella]|nr:hypothetical protein K439DRAFT_1619167 [Ramaria rubella]